MVWTPFNERWGQFKTKQIADLTHEEDGTRIVNAASGGNYHRGAGDIIDLHTYSDPIIINFDDPDRPLVLGEYGGLGLNVEGHRWYERFASLYNDNGSVEGVLRREDRIPGENFETGDMVVALLTEINPDKVGARPMTISRSVPECVAKLFEREVTEISDGLVTIKAVARDPGYRTKIAVYSNEPRIDSVGACVGMRGNRVRNVVRELGGEKVDIIEWSPDLKTFVTNALKPAKLQSISINEDTKTVTVVVPEDQLSLSIGKKGQNARLASRLTGWRLDIVKEDAPEVEADDYESRVRRAIEKIGAVEGIGLEAAETLVRNGFASLEGIVAVVDIEDIASLPGFDHARAEQVVAAAKAAL